MDKYKPPEVFYIGKSLQDLARGVINTYATDEQQSTSEKANFAKTPDRVAKAWPSVYPNDGDQYHTALNSLPKILPKGSVFGTLNDIVATGFPMEDPDEDPGLVTQGPIKATGICPHHLLPVHYEAYVSYLPKVGGTVLGLSKLARVVKALAARPVLQEQVAVDIVDTLYLGTKLRQDIPQLPTNGAAVQLIGEHTCMSCRGVKSDAKTLSTVLRGAYKDSDLKAEFYRAVDSLERHRSK